MASAQQANQGPPARDAEPVCEVFFADASAEAAAQREADGERGMVAAHCGDRGYQFGELDGFVVAAHRDSGAVAVQTIRGSDRRVWLFSQDEGGGVLLEEITVEFARAVGRAATSDLDDVRINLARFRATGVISAIPSGREGARPANAAEISFDERITRARGAPARGSDGTERAE